MRTITKGDPHKIAQKQGEADNLLRRNVAKQEVTGIPQSRAYYDGVEVRLNANGIDQVIIDAPAVKAAESAPVISENPFRRVMVYAAGDLSATSTETLSERSMRYWSSPLPVSIIDTIYCKTIVIADPQRVLTEVEAKVLNLLLSKGRKVFVFPGADTAVYNAILLQLGSNLHLIPMTAVQGKMSTFAPDTQTRYRLPALRRGFLQPIKDHTLTAVASDPFGKMMATSDVVVMTPTFYKYYLLEEGTPEVNYLYGSELLNILETEFVTLTFTRDSYISADLYPDDWTLLSNAGITSWLHTLGSDFFRIFTEEHEFVRDADGWLTYEERNTKDAMGAYAAYEIGKNLYTFGFSPYWMISDYTQSYDDQTDVVNFCKWMESPPEVTSGAFGNVYYPMHPFTLNFTILGGGGGYTPPMQS